MKVGDKVKSIGFFAGLEGKVTEIIEGYDIEDHGCIEILVTKAEGRQAYVGVGNLEHFTFFGWEQHLEVVR